RTSASSSALIRLPTARRRATATRQYYRPGMPHRAPAPLGAPPLHPERDLRHTGGGAATAFPRRLPEGSADGTMLDANTRQREHRSIHVTLSPELQARIVRNYPSDWTELDTRAVDTARVLAADAVQKCGSGHPGTAMSLAPLAYTL